MMWVCLCGMAVGAAERPFALKDLEYVRGPVLATLTGSPGSFTLVDTWAGWCEPCLTRMADQAALQAQYGPERLRRLLVTADASADVRRTLADFPDAQPGAVYRDPQGLVTAWFAGVGLKNLPRTLILDHQGEVVWVGTEPAPALAALWDGTADQTAFSAQLEAGRAFQRMLQAGLEASDLPAQAKRLLALAEPPWARADKAQMLNSISWRLLTEAPYQGGHVPLALAAAEAADAALNHGDANTLDTLARAVFESGKPAEALALQRKVIALRDHPTYYEGLNTYLQALQQPAETYAPPTAAGNTAPATTPPATLTGAQAAADLAVAHDLMRTRYAGYPDSVRLLARSGDDWVTRTARFQADLTRQTSWTLDAFFTVVADYMAPINDVHFYLRKPAADGGEDTYHHFYKRHHPYFTDLRVRLLDGRYEVVAGPDDLLGTHVSDVPLVDARLERNQPYLLPTLPQVAGAREFLVGRFLAAPVEGGLNLRFERADGRIDTRSLPDHRGRFFKAERAQPGYGVHHGPDVPWPTLNVTTCDPEALEGLTATAETLRKAPIAMLDLRGNSGGSDLPVHAWCTAFESKPYVLSVSAGLDDGTWSCNDAFRLAPETTRPYTGTLYVLTDRRVASSGETFTALARQISGAVVLGENTAGCFSYGNADVVEDLPTSRLTLRFGRTKFQHPLMTGFEGMGYLPDYWLDTDDPVAALVAYRALGKTDTH